MTSTRSFGEAVALAVTLGLAAGSWAIIVPWMATMDMGVTTPLGALPSFMAMWVAMMAAMMLPGLAPAVLARTASRRDGPAALPFIGSYLAVWALAGIPVYALYVPHGTLAAGAITVAAGLYELTPLKRGFRRHCRGATNTGWTVGLHCVGSCIGLMLMQAALGVMSLTWMVVTTVLVLAQKLMPERRAVDVPVALAIVGLGLLIVLTPSAVPGLAAPCGIPGIGW